jgi:hypothetical protein
MKIHIPSVLYIGAVLLTGCASTQQFVALPDQSKTVDDPAKGRIYVMRPATMGAAISMNVSDGGKAIGRTGPHGYLCWERPPGDTIISSSSEGVSSNPLTVQAGLVYYFFQHLRMGVLIARSELELLDEQKGREVLKRCHPPKLELRHPVSSQTNTEGSPAGNDAE